jgi:four helix bundle protein
MEEWNDGMMGESVANNNGDGAGPNRDGIRRNVNRGYQKLRVWHYAIDYYRATYVVFKSFPYESRRVASQAMACADSVHRNIAEGYCRKSIREYLYFLNIALGSVGESVSGLHAYVGSGQLTGEEFERLDSQAYQLENTLVRLIASLQEKAREGSWEDTFTLREDGAGYEFGPERIAAPEAQQ